METIETLEAVKEVKASGTFASAEASEIRIARMVKFWEACKRLIPVGMILETIAARLVAGESITVNQVTVKTEFGKVVLPLADTVVFSLVTVRQWGCVACASAHGTGVSPSKGKPKAKGLASNKFFYDPSTRKLVTISASCQKTYVADLGVPTSIFAPMTKAEYMRFTAPAKPTTAPQLEAGPVVQPKVAKK